MINKDTVFVIGAGFNQCITDLKGLNPPMTSNFFETMLKDEKYNEMNFEEVYGYIKKYWKLSKEDLENCSFDLEECFTLIQLQCLDALDRKDKKVFRELMEINSDLKLMFSQYLSKFEDYSCKSNLIMEFGEYVFKEKPNIITLNYDNNLEKAIEEASKKVGREIWKPQCSYGIKFDNLHFNKEDEFDWKILKIHGSLKWYRHLNLQDENDNRIVYDDRSVDNYSEKKRIIIDPIIIPPVLYKDYNQQVIRDIVREAYKNLCICKHLIVIGYSLPPTDFYIKKLFYEAFEKNYLESLIIVNPDSTVLERIKSLVHFEKPALVCNNLREYLSFIKCKS